MFGSMVRMTAVIATTLLVLSAGDPALAGENPSPSAGMSSGVQAGPHLNLLRGPVEPVGGGVWIKIEGMPPGWDTVTVTSPALTESIRLVPKEKGSTESSEAQKGAGAAIRGDIAPGRYALTATSHGHTVATAELTVKPQDPAIIGRFVAGPKGGNLGSADSTPNVTVRPGAEIVVLLADALAAPDEESLTVKSPALPVHLTIKKDSPDDPGCKCDDGSTVYAGHATVRDDLRPGTYTLTVVSHHGQSTSTARLKVAGEPVTSWRPWLIGAAAVLALAMAGGFALRHRRRRARAA